METINQKIDNPSGAGYQSSQTSNDNNNQFALTISEYEEIASRLEDSQKLLELVNDTISTPENLENMRQIVEQKCDKMTVRINIVKKQAQ